mmetsp:Transcript_11222/g.29943  ORF Transcript_11222/g.29943 Transcript_11222/m.29943 type:complete len:321 (-) Transcript_11222:913-1875(-)
MGSTDHPTDLPASDPEGLASRTNREGLVPHPGQPRHVKVACGPVDGVEVGAIRGIKDHVLVDLVADDANMRVSSRQVGDSHQLLFRKGLPRRVVRRVYDQGGCLRPQGCPQSLGIESKGSRRLVEAQRDRAQRGTQALRLRPVELEKRLKCHNLTRSGGSTSRSHLLCPGKGSLQGQEEPAGGPDGDSDLFHGIQSAPEVSSIPLSQDLHQRNMASSPGVLVTYSRLATRVAVQLISKGLNHELWRVVIWKALAQVDALTAELPSKRTELHEYVFPRYPGRLVWHVAAFECLVHHRTREAVDIARARGHKEVSKLPDHGQ